MKVLSVVGARPQFVKLAPVHHALARAGADHVIAHTGQHYDSAMSDVFFSDLGIPAPDVHMSIGSGTHGRQTGAMLAAMDKALEAHQPDWVLVYGDTNSTVAGALSAVKLHVPVAHLEAGLRSFNRSMPEEHNRVVADHLSDLCLAPTQVAMEHLAAEGLGDRSILVGDVMTDVLLHTRDDVSGQDPPVPLHLLESGYRVATLHRPSNTDDPDRLHRIIAAISDLDRPTLLLAHPRLRDRLTSFEVSTDAPGLVLSPPLGYPDLVRAVMGSEGVITDSGGLQKEAFLLRSPCVTIRTETEWTETIDLGWNTLCPNPDDIARTVDGLSPAPTDEQPYGCGDAAQRVVQTLADHHR